jgi:hypothetical protein
MPREFFAPFATCAAIVGLLIAWMLWMDDASAPSEYVRVYDLDYVIVHYASAIPITMAVTIVPLPLATWLRRYVRWIARLRRLDDWMNPLQANYSDASYRIMRRDFVFDCVLAMPLGALLVPALAYAISPKIPTLDGWLGIAALLFVADCLLLFLLAIWLLAAEFRRRRVAEPSRSR